MFDVSLGEFILVLTVMIAFLGPERIPVAARKIGEFIYTVKTYFSQIKDEVTANEEASKVFNEVKDTVQDIATVVNVKRAVREMGKPLLDTPVLSLSNKTSEPENITENHGESPVSVIEEVDREKAGQTEVSDVVNESEVIDSELASELSGKIESSGELEQPFRPYEP